MSSVRTAAVDQVAERLGDERIEKVTGILRAGDSNGDVATRRRANEAVRELYRPCNLILALDWVTELAGT